MEKYDVIIIGGGASGIMCASNITSKSVLIIEQQDKIGKKILATGNGRCNLTNANINKNFYNTNLVEKYFNKFSVNDTLAFFENIGLSTYADEQGRVYPLSNYASSVLDVLRLNLDKKQNVNILTNCKATKIKKDNGNHLVECGDKKFECNHLVFCCGGNFDNIFTFKIDSSKFSPSLCSFVTTKNKGLNGVKQKDVKVWLNNDINKCETGEVLFKENGVSGIAVFNLSSYYNGDSTILNIDLLPNITTSQLINMLNKRVTIFNKCENLLTGLFHSKLCASIMEKCNIDLSMPCNNLTEENIVKIANQIKCYSLTILDTENNNQIYKGGINLECLSDNLEYVNQKKLFFTGEAVNVNGLCGGYNLQWAWTTGKIVADYINKN